MCLRIGKATWAAILTTANFHNQASLKALEAPSTNSRSGLHAIVFTHNF